MALVTLRVKHTEGLSKAVVWKALMLSLYEVLQQIEPMHG